MYEITRSFNAPHDARWIAHGNGLELQTCGASKIVMRVALRPGDGEVARWLVGEVEAGEEGGKSVSVYLYAERDPTGLLHLVMTKEIMSP